MGLIIRRGRARAVLVLQSRVPAMSGEVASWHRKEDLEKNDSSPTLF